MNPEDLLPYVGGIFFLLFFLLCAWFVVCHFIYMDYRDKPRSSLDTQSNRKKKKRRF